MRTGRTMLGSWVLPAVVGVALSLSSTVRFANPVGRNDGRAGSLVVWAGLILGAVAYTLAVAALWWIVAKMTDRQASVVLLVVVGAAVLAFLVAYPKYGEPADSSGYGDVDDALNIVADGITDGFDPYDRTTYEDNELSPMHGAGLVAIPFRELFGSAAYQNPVILMIAAAVLWRRWGGRVALGIVVPVLASLGVAEHYLVGGDYFMSGIAAALVAFLFLAAVERGSAWPWAVAVLLGVVTANRLTTVPVLALLAAVLFASRELRRGGPPLVLAVLVNTALWVPLWLARDGGYPPVDRVGLIGPEVARGAALLLLLAALAWIAAGRVRRPDGGSALDRLAREGGVLAVSGAPSLVWSPGELYRVLSYLWFSVPLLAEHLARRWQVPEPSGTDLVSPPPQRR